MTEQRNVLEDYFINLKTMALVPTAHWDYSTIVFEVDRILFVKKTCMEIIKPSCLRGGSSYDGRREAAIDQTKAKRKVPILIHTYDCIYAIPTQAPTNYNCSWIFYDHIESLYSNPKNPKQCIVKFQNGKELQLDVSLKVMQQQLYRTSICMKMFIKR